MTASPCSSERMRRVIVMAAGLMLIIVVFAATVGPLIVPYEPNAIDLDSLRLPPSAVHFFGTDSKGRDVFSRVVVGARVSLAVGCAAAVVSLVAGILIGLAAGYFGGLLDLALSQMIDIFLAFPGLLLAIGISAVMPPGLFSAMFAITLVSWPGFARLVRGIALTLRSQTYVEAAQAIGASSGRILLRHILPNALPLLIVAASLRIGGFILLEAALSFLGLGVQPPVATWGSMISLNRMYIASAPWMVVFPGIAISLTVISFNILGEYLRDRIDPRMQV